MEVITLHCLTAGSAQRAGRAWRIVSDELLACVDYFVGAGNKRPEGFISQEHSHGISPITDILKPLAYNYLQIVLDVS